MHAKELITDPHYLAYRLDFNSERIGFLRVSGEEVRAASSLSRRTIDPGRELLEVALADVIAELPPAIDSLASKPPRFIFHTAYCASTFVSRCVHVDGLSVSLREPQILLDAANAKRLQWQSNTTEISYRELPAIALALLQKHASQQETSILKPINSVNNIIPELLQACGPTRSLILYTDARNFILSSLRKGEGGMQTVRSMFDLIRCDFPHLSQLQLSHVIHMTDLRVIMTLWRLQIEQAQAAASEAGQDGSMATLYGENVVRDAQSALTAISQHLDAGIEPDHIQKLMRSDLIGEDAKNSGEAFSARIREERYQRLEDIFGNDINDGLEWLTRSNPGTDLVPQLPLALTV